MRFKLVENNYTPAEQKIIDLVKKECGIDRVLEIYGGPKFGYYVTTSKGGDIIKWHVRPDGMIFEK